jgi:hypothetical protein
LRERGIPRSTADRFVARHAETLCSHNDNVPTGAISEPAKPTADKLAEAVWSALRNVLTAGESVVQFIGCIAKVSGVADEWREEGLVILNAIPEAADGLPGSASPQSDPASQPSDDGDAEGAEPAAETATATPANEALAGVTEGHMEEVL